MKKVKVNELAKVIQDSTPEKERYSMYLPVEVMTKVKEIAAKHGTSVSVLVSRILEDAVSN